MAAAPALAAAILGLGLNYAAYEAEVYRAALEGIAPAQLEAARTLGLTEWQVLRLVRAPQAPPWRWRVHITPRCLAQRQVECRVCGEVCDHSAIRFRPQLGRVAQPMVDVQACTGCGECVARCPERAIELPTP